MNGYEDDAMIVNECNADIKNNWRQQKMEWITKVFERIVYGKMIFMLKVLEKNTHIQKTRG